jgi:uncharacterized protein YggE
MKRTLIVALLLLGAAAVAGVARPEGSHAAGSTDTSVRTITVTGTGTATSTPTRASLSFGVHTQAPTAKAALAQNAAEMRKVIDALQSAGAKDVQTQSVALSPVFGDNQDLRGFTADNSVSATVTYAVAGTTIDAAVEAGANQVYGPSPLADDTDALYKKALAGAVANARAHAEALAEAAGAKVGQVTSISEGGAAPVPIAFGKTAAAADSTPVVPGSQETTATVVVTFALS